MVVEAVKWMGGIDGFLDLIDQRRLPAELVRMRIRTVEQLYEAIKSLAVRGAPAIGVAAAYGPVLALQGLTRHDNRQSALDRVLKACDYLATSRPTAVNLFWALDRVRRRAGQDAYKATLGIPHLRAAMLDEANAIYREDIEMCRRIGANGERFIREGAAILTHCNAGALATAGQGTALSMLYEAHGKGKCFEVYADETRPLMQGARLTAWELRQAGIKVTVICDNMAGCLMKQGKIQAVITGADRIAANGDTANKIGTYSLSILAKHHGIPFYVAAPSSTFDLHLRSGDEIPIEERKPEEITWFGHVQTTPDGTAVCNPAFDVTDAQNITAIITDKGVIDTPDAARIREFFAKTSIHSPSADAAQ